MITKLSQLSILPFIIFSILASPVYGISVSCSYHDVSGSISGSQNYNLDDSASLKSISTFYGSQMQQSLEASGNGCNNLQQSIVGNSYLVDNALSSLGAFRASGSYEASSTSARLSQGFAANGESSLAVKGTQGSSEAGQDASVAYGVISSSQSLSAGEGVSASQKTEMDGLTGQVGMGALSQDRALLASGSYLGAGTLSASLDGESRGKADGMASISVDGNQLLRDGDLKDVSQEGTGMAVNGLRLDQTGNLGTFSMQEVSMSRADYEADLGQKLAAFQAGSSASSKSAISSGDGSTGFSMNYQNNPNAYVPTGWKWVTTDPQIKICLKSDTVPNYLDLTATKNAIASAANTWDDAVAQNLFADGDALVTVDPNVQANADDKKNVQSWGSINGGGLAVTTTRYYTTKVNGYYPVYDSDTTYNTNYHWATNGQDIDLQSVA
jgi:hypothetical protein